MSLGTHHRNSVTGAVAWQVSAYIQNHKLHVADSLGAPPQSVRALDVDSGDPYSVTLHPTHYTLHPTPCILHPSPYNLHPSTYTLHPTPHTLHPTPHTLHPSSYTLHPTPCTLNLTPYTLHPTPHAAHQFDEPRLLLAPKLTDFNRNPSLPTCK